MDLLHLNILTINGGSSSIKFALFDATALEETKELRRIVDGQIANIGSPNASFLITSEDSTVPVSQTVDAHDHTAAITILESELAKRFSSDGVSAIGHRVVNGGSLSSQPEAITPELVQRLYELCPLDPTHLPIELHLIETLERCFPGVPNIACFDTAFHHAMPQVAKRIAIPRKFYASGVQRYGFHGLSYAYLMKELARIAGTDAARGRVILAHLGSGASLAAVHHEQPVDTSMGFSPTGGIPMGTRSGDIDPALIWFLAKREQMDVDQIVSMTNSQSGLLGVSETSSDVRSLLAIETSDIRAAEALELFCYAIKKQIGAFAAAMGGIDTLIFSGGIGENSASIRSRVCDGLDFLGIAISEPRNATNEPIISMTRSRVTVRVIPTDEEQMIARLT